MIRLFTPPDGPTWLRPVLDSIVSAFKSQMAAPFWLFSAPTADLPTTGGLGANEGAIAYDETLSKLTVHDGSSWQTFAGASVTLAAGAGLTGGGDLSANRTFEVGAGTGIIVNADDVALDTTHGRNVDHAAVSITAGSGLTGGGDISATRTLNIGAGAGITVNADDVQLDTSSTRNADHVSVTLTAGNGLTGGGDISASRTFAVGAGAGITVNADDVALDTGHARNAEHPASSTDNAVARYDGIAGAIQNSAFVVDDSGHVSSFGGNIKFPATAVASADVNTLDDYEEGTWTPSLTFSGGNTGITYSGTRHGRYTKVGRAVICHIAMILTSKGSSTGTATITGLPFTSLNSLPRAVVAILAGQMNSVAMPVGYVSQNGTTMQLFDFANTYALLTDADFNNNTELYMSFSYDAA